MKLTVTLPVAADAAYALWSWLDARVVDLPAQHLLDAYLDARAVLRRVAHRRSRSWQQLYVVGSTVDGVGVGLPAIGGTTYQR